MQTQQPGNRAAFSTKPQPLLPYSKKNDRPLFMVLVILAFLATLTLLAVASGNRAAAGWKDNLGSAVTVQIKPDDTPGQVEQARDILLNQKQVDTVTIMSVDYAKSLLKPWLGDTPLPDDLPLPTLLDVHLHAGQNIDVAHFDKLFTTAGIRADINDHRQWDRDIKRTTRAAQILSFFALGLIVLASIAAAIFATNAGITSQRQLMDVLHQVGASPQYTARLLSTRFALSGFKAGALGAVIALAVAVSVGFLFSTSGGFSYFLPGLHLSLSDLYVAVAVPIILTITISLTSWRTVSKTLTAEIYP